MMFSLDLATADRLFPFVYLAMLAGPVTAGLLLTGLVKGRAGLREFRSRLFAWRVSVRWYLVALCTAPLMVITTQLILSLAWPAFVPSIVGAADKAGLLAFGISVGLGAGFFEELGWTGFATPELRRRAGILRAGLTLGLLWSAWHFLAVLWGGGRAIGSASPALFLAVDLCSALPVFRVLMVWVYDRTGSLLVAVLMHASLTASVIVLGPAVTGPQTLIYDAALAAILWLLVSAIALSNRGRLVRAPLAHQAA